MSEKRKDKLPLPISTEDLEKTLLDKKSDLFKGVSNEKKSDIISSLKEIISVQTRAIIWEREAPLPTPLELKGYYEIKHEYADTIVKMAQDDQTYLYSRDNKLIEKSFSVKARGQHYAFIIAIVAIVGGIVCVLSGYQIVGIVISGVGLTGLVAEFLEKKNKEK